MKKTLWRCALSSTLLTLSLHAAAAQSLNTAPPPTFAVSEHVTLGNELLLSFNTDNPGRANIPLHLPNGLKMSYGEILSMGDFYALIDKPISKGSTVSDRKARFLTAFHSFATAPAAIDEVNKLVGISKQESVIVNERMKNGESPEAVFKSISNEMGRQFNCATGGGCNENTWWAKPGRYLDVARDNYDHFGDNAIIAYQTGHEAALDQALLAHQTGDRSQLELAYAMNAFACHYLSDRFSAGHIRTPRNELAGNVTPDVVGSLLANYMHGEESAAGLHVHNKRNDRWISYGDWSYFNNNNEQNRLILRSTLQASVDDIYNTYRYGVLDKTNNIAAYIPIPDETDAQSHYDISPMFYWDESTKTLMRRTVLSDPFDRHWTSNWWGWSTLAELREERG